MHQDGKVLLIAFFSLLVRRYLKFQDNLISSLIKAPSAISSRPASSLCLLSVGSRAGKVGIHYLSNNTEGAAGTSVTGVLETGQLPYVEAKWNACGSRGISSCCDLIIGHQIKKKKTNYIRLDLFQFWTKHIIKDDFGFHLSSINMRFPSKYFMNPVGFCAAKKNVKRNQSKGNGLAFGVLGLLVTFFSFFSFFFISTLFFCPEITKLVPDLEYNCLWQ